MSSAKIIYDQAFLRELYAQSPATLLEMAAPSYLHPNPFIRWIVSWRMLRAIQFLNLADGKSLLDFGCGAGILLLQLPKDGRNYYGVDLEIWPAQQMLARNKRADIQLFKGDDWIAAVPDGSLANITALEVLEHVKDLPGTLELFKRKLAPDGRLIVSGPTENRFYQLARKVSGFSGEYHLRNIFTIQAALKQAGFERRQVHSLPLPGPLCLFFVEQFDLGG